MHVHDELFRERLGTLISHLRRGRFGAAHIIERPIGVVHRHKGRGHARRSLEEGTPAHALLVRQRCAILLHARLELPLLRGLRRRHEFVARYRLGRNRRRKGRGLGW